MNGPRLPYRDRREAGRMLAVHLAHYRDTPGLLVLGLARGGVPVAAEVADALGAPLEVFIVRKLGYPGHEEYAIGAIAAGGVRVMKQLPGLHLTPGQVERVAARAQQELERREALYRGGRPAPDVRGRTVIVVDDGLATGATMQAAARALRQMGPLRLCIAAPVAAADACSLFRGVADEVVCPATPEPFRAVSLWYGDFPQVEDAEVQRLLAAQVPRHAGVH